MKGGEEEGNEQALQGAAAQEEALRQERGGVSKNWRRGRLAGVE